MIDIKGQDTISAMELNNQVAETELEIANTAAKAKEEQVAKLSYYDQPTVPESIAAGFRNIPIYRGATSLLNTRNMKVDPDFDPLLYAADVSDAIGHSAAGKLLNTQSKEEFDYMLADLIQQQNNSLMASTSILGQASEITASLLSMENAMFTVATLGVGAYGVTAKTAASGIMANTYRGAVTGAVSGYVGSGIDADYNIGFSHEDRAWAFALGGIGGAAVGRYGGRVLESKPSTSQPLYDVSGALAAAARESYNRVLGKGYKTFNEHNVNKATAVATLKGDIAAKRTAIHQEKIQDFDFERIHDTTFDIEAEVTKWGDDNQIDVRKQNITQAEKSVDEIGLLRSSYATFQMSTSKEARLLGIAILESGTNSMNKNKTVAIEQERFMANYKGGYLPTYADHFTVYLNKKQPTGGVMDVQGQASKLRNYMSVKAEFDSKLYMYMNAQFNGTPLPAADAIIKDAATNLNVTSKRIHSDSHRVDAEGWRDVVYKDGFLPQQHNKAAYLRARAEKGRDTIVALLVKSVQSKNRNIDDVKAKKIASAFVTRYTSNNTNMQAGNLMEDEAWDLFQEIFEAEGLDFAGNSLKAVFNKEVTRKAKDSKRSRYSKGRFPLDLAVEHNGLRMVDLLNTDVENLLGSYAQHMGGQVALANSNIRSIATYDKWADIIVAKDPNMVEPLKDIRDTLLTGRIGGGIKNQVIATATKATVLGMLQTLGLVQLGELGGGVFTYGMANFMKTAPPLVQDMFRGRRSYATSRLAEELEMFFYGIGKEHRFSPPRLNLETQSSNPLVNASLWDKTTNAINMGLSIQGNTSLFNQIRSIEQNLVHEGLMQTIGKSMVNKTNLTEQLASLGISENMFFAIKESMYKHGEIWDNGRLYKGENVITKEMVEARGHEYKVQKDGFVELTGVNDWDFDLAEDFSNVIVRNQNAIVQKSLMGEGSPYMSREVGALLLQFRVFPLESVRKQLLRTHTIGNTHMLGNGLYNAITAGVAITARNYLNGSNTEADFEDALRSGITYNATFGSIPMLWDTGLSLVGGDDAYNINPYSKYSDGIFQIPSLYLANQWSKIPLGLPLDMLDGGLDPDTQRASRTLPVVGNWYGFGHLQRD